MPVFLLNAVADTGLTTLGETFTKVMSWVGELVTTISGTPLLLLATGIFAIGAVDYYCPTIKKSGCIGEA